jgi:hypothetical protein
MFRYKAMDTAIENVKFLCARPGMACPDSETSLDILAAIRGICMGVRDLQGQECLGDLPRYIEERFGSGDKSSWFDVLHQLSERKPRLETCALIESIVKDWAASAPQLPEAIPPDNVRIVAHIR